MPAKLTEATTQVRALYQQRDSEGGVALAEMLLDRFPEDVELQAWTLMNTDQHVTSQPESDHVLEAAVENAEASVEAHPESVWG